MKSTRKTMTFRALVLALAAAAIGSAGGCDPSLLGPVGDTSLDGTWSVSVTDGIGASEELATLVISNGKPTQISGSSFIPAEIQSLLPSLTLDLNRTYNFIVATLQTVATLENDGSGVTIDVTINGNASGASFSASATFVGTIQPDGSIEGTATLTNISAPGVDDAGGASIEFTMVRN